MQAYRLAWLLAFSVLVDFVLMWVFTSYTANGVLAKLGIGLFFAASLLSILARRFAPFGVAFGGLILVCAGIYG
jgi:FtsH-binding integral membrane protein